MRILLTGGSGLVGRNVKEHRKASSHILLSPNREELDLTNKNNIKSWLKENSPEMIIHAAGLVGGIQANISNPSQFLVKNIEIGCNIISEAAKIGIQNIINLGSSCMYPKNAFNPLEEQSILNGSLETTNEGYALAKIATQRLCDYLIKEDKSRNYVTLIPCNLYGKYDNYDRFSSHLIASIIVKLHEAKIKSMESVEVWGNGKAKREFMYVEDMADSIWFAIEKIKDLPNLINIGTGKDFTVIDYYKEAAKIINYKGRFHFNIKKPVGMYKKLLDVRKINNLGWKYKFSLTSGLIKTYNHYLDKLEN